MAAIHGLLNEAVKIDKRYKLHTPSPTEAGEADVLRYINSYIKKIGEPINLSIGKLNFNNIIGANKIEGTPKADIALVSFNGKILNNVCFISHKMGVGAEGFQQYSGTTTKADGPSPGSISQDPFVIKFLSDLVKLHPKIVKDKKRYFRTITSSTLVGKSVYGPLYGSRNKNEDNIDLLGQGYARMSGRGKSHELTFTSHTIFGPNVKPFMNGDYTAIIGARYSSGRNFTANGKEYSGVRVLIMPKRLIGGQAEEI